MSRFMSEKNRVLSPYVPGEQPKTQEKIVKLNTNESPFPPSPLAVSMAKEKTENLQLYCDPTAAMLKRAISEEYGVPENCIAVSNGSDELLDFAFQAFSSYDVPAVFPDITYGFYPVFARRNHVPFLEKPLDGDLRIDPEDYISVHGMVVIANPNAPTGIMLGTDQIERIVSSRPDTVTVVDEAYVDFGGESALPLIKKYPNLLVVRTFSKSRSLAGARLGYGFASEELISDIETIRNSTNPYNVNSVTMAAGTGAMKDREYTENNCRTIIRNREKYTALLKELGFVTTDSKANFIFAKHEKVSGKDLYLMLKERGVLIRHFDLPRITEYNRITVGSEEQMDVLIKNIKEILEEIR